MTIINFVGKSNQINEINGCTSSWAIRQFWPDQSHKTQVLVSLQQNPLILKCACDTDCVDANAICAGHLENADLSGIYNQSFKWKSETLFLVGVKIYDALFGDLNRVCSHIMKKELNNAILYWDLVPACDLVM